MRKQEGSASFFFKIPPSVLPSAVNAFFRIRGVVTQNPAVAGDHDSFCGVLIALLCNFCGQLFLWTAFLRAEPRRHVDIFPGLVPPYA